MNLRILHSQVIYIELRKTEPSIEGESPLFELEYASQYDTDDDTVFNIVFDIRILHPNDFELKCQYVTWFKTSGAIDDKFKTSDFPKVNAPAIAFPFLRSFISTITLNAGYSPAILPSINFVTFAKNKTNK